MDWDKTFASFLKKNQQSCNRFRAGNRSSNKWANEGTDPRARIPVISELDHGISKDPPPN
jgi:hypothetical protein